MIRHLTGLLILIPAFLLLTCCHSSPENGLAGEISIETIREGFRKPDAASGPRCWWWWLNSNVTKESITRDLEAMHDKGFSGAMIFDAGTETWWGPDENPPNGPVFSGPEWTELYLHALKEAERLGLELGLSIQSGWNLGGPEVTLDEKAKQVTWSEVAVEGGSLQNVSLPLPPSNYDYYRDICVLAYPSRTIDRQPISHLSAKSGAIELGGSAPDCRFLLDDHPPVEGEYDARAEDIVELTENLRSDGTLEWDVPPGTWTVLRIGYTPTTAHVATSSDNWKGHVIDYLSTEAFNAYWDRNVEHLLQKAGPLAGTVLKQLETDSWECGGMNWSTHFAAEFKDYTGYDISRYLPVMTGKIIDSRQASNAFLADLRKTIAHLVSENHYRVFAERAAAHDLGIQPECSGPHAAPLDGITNYSHSEITMSEFWIPSPHRPNPENRYFVKQAASAAHIYGKQFVGAESFTSLRKPHWGVEPWHDMKPSMDYEFCEGLNLIFFHTFTSSPEEMGVPGQEYFAGTHVNPQVTWWEMSGPFMEYITRVQSVVQHGTFVADVLYYYGDHVPNIAGYKGYNRSGALPGYDYDVTNEEVLLQLTVEDGRIVVPSGLNYRLLVLPDHRVLSLAALEKVSELLQKGATVLGPRPERLVSLVGGAAAQERFHALAKELWGTASGETGRRSVGKGTLAWGISSREYLQSEGIGPDFEVLNAADQLDFQYIRYMIGDAHIYFVCNQTGEPRSAECAFRLTGRQPELWDPVTGSILNARSYRQEGGRTVVPLELDPYGSLFVCFAEPIPTRRQGDAASNVPAFSLEKTVGGPWQVAFDPAWGGPESIRFDSLTDWTMHPDEGIRHYSGTATYSTDLTFTPEAGKQYRLRLNRVKDVGIAAVRINGRDAGTVWTAPFDVDITGLLTEGTNRLEIDVVNSWQNRLIGDRGKPQEERYTMTNIRIKDEWTLRESGLLGPVELLGARDPGRPPGD
jgi:hypothetical protein